MGTLDACVSGSVSSLSFVCSMQESSVLHLEKKRSIITIQFDLERENW